MRNLAVSTEQRLQAAPTYPTLRELGYDVTLTSWWGGFVPARRRSRSSINSALGSVKIVASEEARNSSTVFASDPWVSSPEQAQAYFREEIKAWGDYVRIAKIDKQG